MRNKTTMEMSICQAENGFSLDELVKKFTDAFENKAFADILIGAILCMFMIDSRLSIKNILTCDSKNTARAAQIDLFTSDQRERLHPPSHKGYGGQASKASLVFGEDVKKKLCFFSEVVPDGTVK